MPGDALQEDHASLFKEGDTPRNVRDERGMQERAAGFRGDTSDEISYDPVEVDLSEPAPEKPVAGKKEDVRPIEPRAAPRLAKPERESGIEELQRQLAQQREATRSAQTQAMELGQRASMAEQRAAASTVGMIDSAISEAQRASAMAAGKYESAMATGDYRTASSAQIEIADARHNLLRLQEQKAIVESEPPPQVRRAAPGPHAQPQPQQFEPDRMIQGLVSDGYPRSAEWLQKHPELMNQQQISKVTIAHNHLVANRGLIPETDAYFSAMENEIFWRGEPQSRSAPASARRAVAAAAPVNSSAPVLRTGETQQRSGYVHLTSEQRKAAAEIHGMTDREYAEAFEDARSNGQLMLGRTQ